MRKPHKPKADVFSKALKKEFLQNENPIIQQTKFIEQLQFDFTDFFAVWATLQGWEVPVLHLRIIRFLERHPEWFNNTAVLQVFRGAAKSTIVGLFVTYQLVKDPTLRFMILSADHKTAGKVVADVISIIQRHPLAQHLHGKENTWRANTIFVSGYKDARSPSVTSWGIMSNLTGSRADWIIFDDVEVPKNASTQLMRETLRLKLAEPQHILVPGGKQLFIGTPHSYESIYPEIVDDGAESLKIPLVEDYEGEFPNITGTSSWPERFPIEEILDRQRKAVSKANFLSQYQLIPYNADDSVLDPTLMTVYRNEIDLYQANKETVLRIGNQRMVSCSVWWDPALSQHSTDDSVISVVFSDNTGHYYIHRVQKLTGNAEEQAKQVKELALSLNLPHVTIETNGIGAFLPAILRQVVAGTGISVEGKGTRRDKAEKIIHAYEARLSAGYIHCHYTVWESPFVSQMRDFNPKLIGRGKDDFIDSVASAILNEPIRVTTGWGPDRKKRWVPYAEGVQVEMDKVEL